MLKGDETNPSETLHQTAARAVGFVCIASEGGWSTDRFVVKPFAGAIVAAPRKCSALRH